MRADEECAKDQVLELLRHDFGPIEVRPGDEPPDYYFTIRGQDFALEVTSLHQQTERRGRVQSRHGQEVGVERWFQSVKQRALEQGVLRGAYLVSFLGDLTALLENQVAAQERLLEYLVSTQDSKAIECQSVYLANEMRVGVSKYDVGQDALLLQTGITGWPLEIQANADTILWEVLNEKREKLSQIGLPCILAFHNWYPMADPENYADSLSRSRDTFFRGVYLIDEGRCTPLRRLSLS